MNNLPVRVEFSRQSRHGRVYIAGPMTGILDFNFPAFNAEAAKLRDAGFCVENPAEHGIWEGAEWQDYLRYDLTRLALCDQIHLLPGWSKSKGACLELHIARALGMLVSYADGAELVPAGEREAVEVVGWMHSATGSVTEDAVRASTWISECVSPLMTVAQFERILAAQQRTQANAERLLQQEEQARRDDAGHNLRELFKRGAAALGLEPDETSWFEIVGELEKLAAAPAAAAQGIYPECDYCGTEPDHHPWHGSGMLNGFESRHIHACNACRSLLPAQDVAGLVEALRAADEYLSDNSFNEIGSRSILHRQMQDALAAHRAGGAK